MFITGVVDKGYVSHARFGNGGDATVPCCSMHGVIHGRFYLVPGRHERLRCSEESIECLATETH